MEEPVKNQTGAIIGYIDRSLEGDEEDGYVYVKLPCGFELDFWMKGLTDEEYIWRANQIKRLEQHEQDTKRAHLL